MIQEKSTNLYGSKLENYFSAARKEILDLMPTFSSRVLEIGCGAGQTLELIKHLNLCSETVGIELFEQASQKASKIVDRVYHLDIENEETPSEIGQFELILILDVLEHLVDPWSVLARIKNSHLRPDGKMIISLPNARHFSLLLPLLLSGEFGYKERGILDKTHRRFFTRSSGEQMLHDAGLIIQNVKRTSLKLSLNSGKLNALSLGLFSEFLISQYIYLVKNRENA